MKPLFKRRMLAVGAASAAALMALTGCFGGSSSPSNGEGGDDRIALAMLQPPRSGLSPLSDDATKLSRWATIETLVVLDEEGLAQPALATDWEQVDEITWRFTIRDGVLFLPFHYGYCDVDDGHERAANELTLTDWDPASKQPLFKTAAAAATRVAAGTAPAAAPTNTGSAPRGGTYDGPRPVATHGAPDSDERLQPAGGTR